MKAVNLNVLLLLFFASCTIYSNLPIEVLKPTEIHLPWDNRTIALLYRNFKYKNDTLQKYYLFDNQIRKERDNPDLNIDSLAVTRCLNSVASAFSAKGFSGKTVIIPVNMMPFRQDDKIAALPSGLVQKLAAPVNADYVISLETYSSFFSYFPGNYRGEKFQQVAMAGIWAVYEAETGNTVDRKTMVDTVYWHPGEKPSNVDEVEMPPRIAAIEAASELFGEYFAGKFFSDWITVERIMIIPPVEDFRLASEYAADQEWDKATGLWEPFSEKRFGKLAICACYNMALAAEINDDIQEAIRWIDMAYAQAKTYNRKKELDLVMNYKNILMQRLSEIEKDIRYKQLIDQ